MTARSADPYRDPGYAQAARARSAGQGLPNPYAERTPVVVRTSAQFRDATRGKTVRALPTATQRRVKRRVRRARKTAVHHLAVVGMVVLVLLIVAVAAAVFGYVAG